MPNPAPYAPNPGAPPSPVVEPGQPAPAQAQPAQDQAQSPDPASSEPSFDKGTNVFAILSLIFAVVFAPLGLIFGLVALHQIKTSGQGGRGLAIAGIVISLLFFILPVIIALGAIAYFGVLSPDQFLPERCTAGLGIGCIDFQATESDISLVFQNGVGFELTDVQVTIDGCSPSQQVQTWANGAEETFVLSCSGLSSGEKADKDFTVSYTNTNSGLEKKNQGNLITKVK